MTTFAMRNLKLFFRDRAAVFFSLLAVFVIIGLYVLFLGDMVMGDLEGVSGGRFLMDSWIMAGLMAVTSVTTTMGAVGVVVDDKAKGITKDFHTSPLKRTTLVGGYLVSTIVVGMIMSVVALVLAELYIVGSGGEFLPWGNLLKVLGLIFLSTMTSGSMMFLMVSFFNTQNAFGVASTVLGTLIGFLMGIYVPIGVLPSSVQTVIKIFPISHAAALFRQVFMEVPMASSFAGAPPEMVEGFQTAVGVIYQIGDGTVSFLGSMMFLVATTVLFFGLGVWRMLVPPKR
ncbi:MAG TPA: ABC transporter [Firmicutes bacterium]|jgi:multidrug/hemolysin transport system permease protein|nr:ABC transporter [Bacillota bacterium]